MGSITWDPSVGKKVREERRKNGEKGEGKAGEGRKRKAEKKGGQDKQGGKRENTFEDEVLT